MTMRELANVSVSTVSKAFHDADDISEETRQMIFRVAREYGCYGQFYKGKFHKQVIAIISPEIGSGFYAAYVERLQRIIRAHNGIALISADEFSEAAQAELLDYYASYLRVDGIVAFSLKKPIKKGYDIPIVSLFSAPDPRIDTVSINLEAPMEEAVDLLRSLGHEKIGFLGEQLTEAKAAMFRKIISDASAPVIQSEFRFEKAGEDAVEQLLARETDCTALICAYDNIALGAIRQLRRRGYRVPEDVSVVGIDNIASSEHVETALTTIDTNPDEVCMLAWDLIQKKQQSKHYRSNQAITITGKLIVRETVDKRKG